MDSSSTTAPQPPPTQQPKQGFRFNKSGAVSPIIPRVPSHPSLISESGGGDNSNNLSAAISSAAGVSGGVIPAGVDPKLYQVVKRIASSTPSFLITSSSGNKASQQARKNNIQAVTSLVLDKHREYRRKDLNWVRSGVEGALVALSNGSSRNNNNKSSSSSVENKKRRASSAVPVGGGSNNNNNNNTLSEQSFDRPNLMPKSPAKKKRVSESVETDLIGDVFANPSAVSNQGDNSAPPKAGAVLARSNSGGMLNAGLRNRYKDVQRGREKEQLQQQAQFDVANGDVTAAVSDNSNADGGDGKAGNAGPPPATEDMTGSPNNITPNSNSTTTATAATTTPGAKKKKKTKKTPSKSSSSASNYRTQDMDNNEGGSPYSSSAALLQPSPRPTERYSNLGGISSLLQQLRELIEYPLSHPELFLHLGVEPPRGVLLRGPPGCGKTHLAKAIAGELNVSYFQVSAPELVGGVSGESELRVRTLFDSASNYAPAIIFIDEIDAIAPSAVRVPEEAEGVNRWKNVS
jgi:hypothetical protein